MILNVQTNTTLLVVWHWTVVDVDFRLLKVVKCSGWGLCMDGCFSFNFPQARCRNWKMIKMASVELTTYMYMMGTLLLQYVMNKDTCSNHGGDVGIFSLIEYTTSEKCIWWCWMFVLVIFSFKAEIMYGSVRIYWASQSLEAIHPNSLEGNHCYILLVHESRLITMSNHYTIIFTNNLIIINVLVMICIIIIIIIIIIITNTPVIIQNLFLSFIPNPPASKWNFADSWIPPPGPSASSSARARQGISGKMDVDRFEFEPWLIQPGWLGYIGDYVCIYKCIYISHTG